MGDSIALYLPRLCYSLYTFKLLKVFLNQEDGGDREMFKCIQMIVKVCPSTVALLELNVGLTI